MIEVIHAWWWILLLANWVIPRLGEERHLHYTDRVHQSKWPTQKHCSNQKFLSLTTYNTYTWHMQNSRKIKPVEWMDKTTIAVNSHVPYNKSGMKLWPYFNAMVWFMVNTRQMHLQYTTTLMRDIDFTDQLKGRYCCQLPRHKRMAYKDVHFMLDTTTVNSWILHKECMCTSLELPKLS